MVHWPRFINVICIHQIELAWELVQEPGPPSAAVTSSTIPRHLQLVNYSSLLLIHINMAEFLKLVSDFVDFDQKSLAGTFT